MITDALHLQKRCHVLDAKLHQTCCDSSPAAGSYSARFEESSTVLQSFLYNAHCREMLCFTDSLASRPERPHAPCGWPEYKFALIHLGRTLVGSSLDTCSIQHGARLRTRHVQPAKFEGVAPANLQVRAMA